MMTVRIESGSRWDALALARKLDRYSWYLVEPNRRHWYLYVSLEDDDVDNVPDDLIGSLLDWLDERQVDTATVHMNAADIVLARK